MAVTDPAQTDPAQTESAPPAERGPLLVASGLEKHFPVRRGLLQRQVGAVRAVDGLDFEVLRAGRRCRWWGSRAAARPPPAG